MPKIIPRNPVSFIASGVLCRWVNHFFLNIALLWELASWIEAKKYWQELTAGKYEWSFIGKQMREKGILKC